MSATYAAPAPADHAELIAMARAAFDATFASHYDPAEFTAWLDATYAPDGPMAADLADPAIAWRVARLGGRIAGYAKLSPLTAPQPDAAPDAVELRQIYLTEEAKGRGIADALMGWALDIARAGGAREIYLTVFDHNARAKAFYARHGFAETGRCTFTLGSRTDDDRIWGRKL